LIAAKERYFDDVEAKPLLLDRAWDRFNRDGFLDLGEFQSPARWLSPRCSRVLLVRARKAE
jgi:hypothetical protein